MSQKQPVFAVKMQQNRFCITRNGHTMFLEDVVKELHSLQRQNTALRQQLAAHEKGRSRG